MDPILKTACETFEAKMAAAIEDFVKEGGMFDFGGGSAKKDSTNLKDPAQRASFMKTDPNKGNYGPRMGGTAKPQAGPGKERPSTEPQEQPRDMDPSVKEQL